MKLFIKIGVGVSVGVGGTGVAVGSTGVAVGGIGVAVGGIGVAVTIITIGIGVVVGGSVEVVGVVSSPPQEIIPSKPNPNITNSNFLLTLIKFSLYLFLQ